ncbi:MAG: DNA primase [Clostridia bacterium]|nr:DNA primase [Clostridia bacterium]
MASRLPDAWLDELRSRVEITDVVAEYVELKQKGRRFWGRCPFHGEKTPSFSVDSEAQMFYCFGCHKGGTVINFIMEIERMEFMEAVKLLADRAHMELPARVDDGRSDEQTRALRERIYEANLEAARFYHATIWTEEGAEALSYLHKRGLDDAGIRRFGLGSTAHGWDALTRHLTEQGFTFDELKQAGLASERDGRRYDMFRGRAMFPIINPQGRVLGFGGRIMGEGNPKYLNTSDTPVFNKRQGLYALNLAKKERGLKRLILVEGYMDVVSLRQQGVQGVVATLGTALTEEQARLIKRYAPEVWVCYDGDSAGQKAILRALDIFESQEMPAKVIDIPDDMDPDDYVKKNGAEGFEALRPMPPAEYRMLRAADGVDLTTQDGRTQYAIACCSILRRVSNPVELENYLKKLSVQTGFEREVLLKQIGTVAPAAEEKRTTRPVARWEKPETTPEHVKAEQLLINLIARGQIDRDLPLESAFVTPLYLRVARELSAGESPAAILERLEDSDREAAAQALMMDSQIERDQVARAVEECLEKIERYRKKTRIEEIKEQLKGEASPDRKTELLALLTQLMNEPGSARKP